MLNMKPFLDTCEFMRHNKLVNVNHCGASLSEYIRYQQ